MRTVIIGDIHGCADRLQSLLRRIGFDPAQNELILLGNLMDYGPDSFGVYRMVRDLKEAMGKRLVILRGDHDQMLMDANLMTRGQMANSLLWKQNGGNETVRSFKAAGQKVSKAAVWLRDNTRTWYEDLSFLCVHGDIRDEVIWNNSDMDLIWGRQAVLSNDYSGKLCIVGSTPMESPTYLDGSGAESAFHPPCGTWFELPKRGLIALDTGCGKLPEGKLTAMLVENGWMRFEQ